MARQIGDGRGLRSEELELPKGRNSGGKRDGQSGRQGEG